MSFTIRIAAALFALACLAGSSAAFQVESSPTLEAARVRWERLSPEEKTRLEQNYQRYRALSEEERRGLADRARRLRDERERVRARLPEETREKLQQLEPEKRREVLRDLVEGEAREKGARIREKMPEAWIQRLEQARPEDRARFLAEFQRKARERVVQAAFDKIGRKLELPREEIERLKALPHAERAARLLELKKRLSAQDAELFGLPSGITQAQWDEWQTLSPERFFEVMQRYRRERERELDQRGATAQNSQVLRALDEAVRTRPDDVVELAHLTPPERRQKIFQIRRDRVVQILREHRLVPPNRIAELERMSEMAFLRTLRDVVVRPLVAPRAQHPAGGETRPRR